jgi:hypothetical protein
MRDFVLAIIGAIGIFALSMTTKNVKENFIQVPMRFKNQLSSSILVSWLMRTVILYLWR